MVYDPSSVAHDPSSVVGIIVSTTEDCNGNDTALVQFTDSGEIEKCRQRDLTKVGGYTIIARIKKACEDDACEDDWRFSNFAKRILDIIGENNVDE